MEIERIFNIYTDIPYSQVESFSASNSRSRLCLAVALLTAFLYSCVPAGKSVLRSQTTPVTEYDWRVVRVLPHDTTAFTQGLLFHDGYLYESTGRRGRSEIRKVRMETGEIVRRHSLDDEYFGEGLTLWNNRLIQLTLSSGTGFVYDVKTFEVQRTFPVEGTGWGLTTSGDQLIMSDGSASLRFLDPETFREIRRINVTDAGEPVSRLNELEMIGGRIFANRLSGDEIIIIDPAGGKVTGRINLERLVTRVKHEHSVNILNGIAYDSINDRIFITGKLWPNIYEIKIRPVDRGQN